MKRRVNVGKDFDITNVSVEDEVKKKTATTQSILVNSMVAIGAVFLLGAALMGLYDGTFDELNAVWDPLAILFGMVITYYFGPKGGEGG